MDIENIVKKGENAGYKHILIFPTWIQKLSLLGVIKIRDSLVKGKPSYAREPLTCIY